MILDINKYARVSNLRSKAVPNDERSFVISLKMSLKVFGVQVKQLRELFL